MTMKLSLVFLITALAFSLATTGVTPLAPAGLAYAKKCSKEKCRQGCGSSRNCDIKCNLCDRP
jgi:hypothetical protein